MRLNHSFDSLDTICIKALLFVKGDVILLTVLAFDPGGTTGYAHGSISEVKEQSVTNVVCGTFADWHYPGGLEELILKVKPDVIVYEIFALYAHKAAAQAWKTFVEIEAIGVIKYLGEKHDIPVIGQTPAEGKHFWNDEKLKRVGLYAPITHERDAIRHLLYYEKFGRYKKNG